MQSTSGISLQLPPLGALRGGQPALWLASLVVGGLAATVVYDAEPGLNWALTAIAIVGGAVALERPTWPELRSRRYQALGLVVMLAGAAAITANISDHFLLFIGIGWLGAVASCIGAGQAPSALGPGRLAGAPFAAPLIVLREASAVVGAGVRVAGSDKSAPLLRGALIATLVVGVFIALLGQADPTLGALRDAAVDLVVHLDGIGRLASFGAVALASLGFLHLRLRPRQEATSDVARANRHTDLERVIVLGSVAALFATFLLLQVPYLFGNPGARAGSGVTLAEAVHRGFGEISIVVSLTAVIIAFLDRDALRGAREQWVRVAASVVLIECLLLLVSAYYRVVAYEDAYGYTEFRLFVRIYIGVLTIVTLLLAREMLAGLDLPRFCWRTAVTSLLALATICCWNYSGWVVQSNVERFRRSGRIDVGYLMATRVNGLPELVHSLPLLPPPDRERLSSWALERRAFLRVPPGPAAAWYEWNLRRAAARAAYEELISHAP